MDVHCSTCNEPWDVYYLLHEIIFDTCISNEEAEIWRSLPRTFKLCKRYRTEFRTVGWEFGQTVINIIRCPACPKDAKPNIEKNSTKAELEKLMSDDEDGLASTFEDFNL
jgi:hypothetical protein